MGRTKGKRRAKPAGTMIVGSSARGAGGRPKVARADGWFWTAEAEEIFFATLASSANVKMSAEAAGFDTSTVYRHRLKRADFAEKWRVALTVGFERLEAALLRAAIDSVDGVAIPPEWPIPAMSVDQAMTVLQHHRAEVHKLDRRGPGPVARPRTIDEVRASIMAKIDAIERAAASGTLPPLPDEEA